MSADQARPTLQVITASTRPGRIGKPISDWFLERVEGQAEFSVDYVDLAELSLPFMDEPNHPRFREYQHAHTKSWSARVEKADAVVFVMPEYNYGFNAPLKNAIDYLHVEWFYKPLGLISYGGVSAGTRAAQMIKQVVTTLKMVPLFEAVSIPFVAQFIDDEGRFQPDEQLELAADAMLAELLVMQATLAPLRAASASPR